MSRERRIGVTLLGAGLLIALTALAIYLAHETSTLRYTVIFNDAKGIRPGDRVQMNGVDIGVVQWRKLQNSQPPQVDVRLKIDPEYAGQIRANSTAIVRDVAFPNVSGQRVIEVVNADVAPPAPPLPNDAIVYGVNGSLELQMWKLKHQFRNAGDAAAQTIGVLAENIHKLGDTIGQIAASPKTQQVIRDLQGFLKEMNEQGRQAAAELKRRWPDLERKLQPVLRELHDFGHNYLAEQIRQIMAQIEQTLKSWNQQLPSRPSPRLTPTPTP